MRILFLGDVVGEPGRGALRVALPELRDKWSPDFVVVNGENAAGGHGITPRLTYELLRMKVDVVTLGDHCWDQREVLPFFAEEPRLIRPFNFPSECPGSGWVVVSGNGKKLGVVSAMGRTFMGVAVSNPFTGIEAILTKVKIETPVVLIDFHAETTSESVAFGHFCAGKVSAVVGTHTHVQTADEKVLEGGTAYITDVGFCGGHDGVIGRDKEVIIRRFRTLMPARMVITGQQPQVDGVVIDVEEHTGRATSIERIQHQVVLAEG